MSETQAVHRILVGRVEAAIREEAGSYSVELATVGHSGDANRSPGFARDDLLSLQEVARQSYEWICYAQGETVLTRKT
ncbi:MAG: hypothetical protein KatS3mg108_2588 [Isosphaeraceae bacterium]|jgi:hypothetical protein|nr:MAG: hypothetical protein KatS3mg108_2588 [Isosphaeraceae bacterium]